jgi:hypothetical protein
MVRKAKSPWPVGRNLSKPVDWAMTGLPVAR